MIKKLEDNNEGMSQSRVEISSKPWLSVDWFLLPLVQPLKDLCMKGSGAAGIPSAPQQGFGTQTVLSELKHMEVR